MANQVAEGNILLGPNQLKGFSPGELLSLKSELERIQREVRGVPAPVADSQATQNRSRKITRVASAIQAISNKMSIRG